MAIKKGTTYNSRKKSDFIKRMSRDEQEEYIKRWIASCNAELLIPYVSITKFGRHFREIQYEIDVPKENAETQIKQIVAERDYWKEKCLLLQSQ